MTHDELVRLAKGEFTDAMKEANELFNSVKRIEELKYLMKDQISEDDYYIKAECLGVTDYERNVVCIEQTVGLEILDANTLELAGVLLRAIRRTIAHRTAHAAA